MPLVPYPTGPLREQLVLSLPPRVRYVVCEVKPVGDSIPPGPFKALGEEERKKLLQLARRSLVEYFQNTVPSVVGHDVKSASVPFNDPALNEARGCFVTLMRRGSLRGCVGNVVPRLPLWQAVVQNARSAAFSDSRFPPLERDELEEILIEISVLTPPVILRGKSRDELLRQIRPRVDGVLLQVGERISTFLPQVWDKLPAPMDFMNCLARKSGLAPEAWRDPGAVISVYQAEFFTE